MSLLVLAFLFASTAHFFHIFPSDSHNIGWLASRRACMTRYIIIVDVCLTVFWLTAGFCSVFVDYFERCRLLVVVWGFGWLFFGSCFCGLWCCCLGMFGHEQKWRGADEIYPGICGTGEWKGWIYAVAWDRRWPTTSRAGECLFDSVDYLSKSSKTIRAMTITSLVLW